MMIVVYILAVLLFIVVTLAILIRIYGPQSSRVVKPGAEFSIQGNKHILGEFNINKKIYMMKDHILDDFYDLIKYSDYILSKHNIQYTAAYGTLLGAMRHKGIMPWDDDADLYIHVPLDKYDETIRPLKEEMRKDGYDLRMNYDTDYFHVSKIGAPIGFPYIDWYQYKFPYTDEQTYPIKRVPYEDFEICVPQDPMGAIDVIFNKSGTSDPMNNIVSTYPIPRYYSLWIAQLLKRYPVVHKTLERISKMFFDVQ